MKPEENHLSLYCPRLQHFSSVLEEFYRKSLGHSVAYKEFGFPPAFPRFLCLVPDYFALLLFTELVFSCL